MTTAIHLSEISRPMRLQAMGRVRRVTAAAMLAMTVSGIALVAHTPALAQEPALVGPAWTAADKAYAAYQAKDYATAATQAREALRLRPDVARLWLLLMDALDAQGNVADSVAAAKDAIAAGVQDPTITARLRSQSKVLAQAPSLAANKALEARNPKAALAEIRKAIALVPDDLSYRVLLIYALIADDQIEAAEQAATAAIAVDPKSFLPQVLRGYLRERLGRINEANQDFDTALTDEVLTGPDARDVRLVIADAAIAAGNPRRALKILDPLGDTQDPAVKARRDAASAQDATPSIVPKDAFKTLPVPYQKCRDTPYGPACTLVPATTPPGAGGVANPGFKAADEAYKAYADGNYALAEKRIREALAVSPSNAAWRRLLIDTLERSNQFAALDAAIGEAIAAGEDDPALLGLRGMAQTRLGEPSAVLALKQMAEKNPKAAVESAKKAVQQAPHAMVFRIVLIQALMAAGQTKEAAAAAASAVEEDENDVLPRILRAYLLQATGNRAGAVQDFDKVLASNVLTDQEILNYSLIAANAALAAGKPDDAIKILKALDDVKNADVESFRKTAEAMLANPNRQRPALAAPVPLCQSTNYGIICSVFAGGTNAGTGVPSDPGYEAADASIRALKARNYSLAISEARRAVELSPRNITYRQFLINALSTAGRTGEAETAATQAIAAFPGEVTLVVQRGYIRQRLSRYGGAAADFSAALRSGRLPAADVRGVRLALVDAYMGAKDPQAALDALAPLGRERSYDVVARRGFALQALGRHEEALETFEFAYRLARTPTDRANIASAVIGELVALGRKDEAKARFQQALATGELRAMQPLDIAYLANQSGDTATAYKYFHQVDSTTGLRRGMVLVDAAYAAKHEYHNEESAALFKRAIDAHADGALPLPAQTVFGLRREVGELERTWGAYASVSYGAVGVMPGSPLAPPPGGGGHTIQSGAEVYWRPPGIGYRDGALVEVFGRVFTTLYDQSGGPTGVDTMQGSVGVRWKPLKDQNLVLEASRLFPIGTYSRNDWLLRAAYSNGEGSDLRVDVNDWNYWQFYADTNYYVELPESVSSFEFRWGHSFRVKPVNDNLIVTPFLAVGGAYDSVLNTPGTLGAGPGVNLRWWFREDKYTAPMSYVDLTAQYRFKLAGDSRGEGLFAGAFVSY
ncbi:NfrA family protein [Roseixanthobacter liquoris]|uniref:NfrA family protein n=1 Tax=Roseixanthobacter liquoris TaxID=3119921 RepID=UPI00372C62AF